MLVHSVVITPRLQTSKPEIIMLNYLHNRVNQFNCFNACSQVAAKVIGEVQALIIFPLIPYGILVVFYMFWISASLHMFSSGQVVQNNCNSNCCTYDLTAKRVNCDRCCGYSIHYTPHIGVAILFHLFGCYWATQFFIACSSTVIAGSVASYYWAHGETSVSCMPCPKCITQFRESNDFLLQSIEDQFYYIE